MKRSYSFFSSSSSSSSSKPPKKYDVFLSFRGEDTRNNVTGFLYRVLKEKGIHTFLDDGLEKGKDISKEVLETIEESSCSIIVLSTNYANSIWCLKELVKILDCKKTREQIVLPIFFLVEPTHVKNKTGAFGEAFTKHKQDFRDQKEKAQMTENERKNMEEDLKRWEDALTEVGKISGWHLTERDNQAEFIDEFVLKVSKEYVGSPNIIPEGLFGMHSRMEKLDSYVYKSENGVEFIGICGMGGIGKSTIARTFYELNKRQFEGSSFLGKVKDKRNDLESLVKQLLSDTLKGECTTNGETIRNRLCRKKVLVVIDDVDHLDQLETLVGEPNWFGSGSRIIITTRDKSLLIAHGVKEIYNVVPLDGHEALQLFTWNAGFKDVRHFSDEYKTLSVHFLIHAHGLPLALQVLGSSLRGKDVAEWTDQLDRLRNNPKTEIIEVLQISFDKLEEREMNIFLLIVCFFERDDNKDYVTSILDKYCNFNSRICIKILCDKSLLSFKDNKLWVHDLLKEMSCKILGQKSLIDELGGKIKLWNVTNVSHVLKNCTSIEEIEAVVCSDLPKKCPTKETLFNFLEVLSKMKKLKLFKLCGLHLQSEALPILQNLSNELLILHWSDLFETCPTMETYLNCIEVLSKMKKLKLLKLNGPNEDYIEFDMSGSSIFPNILQYLSNEILVLKWRMCPFQYFPSSFQPTQLIEVDMSGSSICRLWDTIKPLPNLRSVRLNDCDDLTTIFDDFTLVPNLEELELSSCEKLLKIDPSIKVLGKLTNLDLRECSNLDNLPPSLNGMESLKFLHLFGCWNIRRLPEDIGYLKSLEKLHIKGTRITELPSSIVLLENLRELSFGRGVGKTMLNTIFGQGSLSVGLKYLKELDLSRCNLGHKSLKELDFFVSLERLDLSYNHFVSLPASISRLSKLKVLKLGDCNNLLSLTELPSSLKFLYLNDCSKLQKLPEDIGYLKSLEELHIKCTAITELPSSIVLLENLRELSFDRGVGKTMLNTIFGQGSLPVGLKYLKELDLSRCNLGHKSLKELDFFVSLEKLDLSYNDFVSLPASISRLSKLRSLYLNHCSNLLSLTELPSSLRFVDVSECTSLDTFLDPSKQSNLPCTALCIGCHNLARRQGSERTILTSLQRYIQNVDPNISETFNIVLPGSKIPDWFNYQNIGSSISIKLDPNWCDDKWMGFALCMCFKNITDQVFQIGIQLRSLTELPSSLPFVDVSGCTSLDTFLDPSKQSNLPCTALCIGCHNLARRQGSERTILTSLQRYIARRQGSERTLPTWVLRYILNVDANTFNIIFPGSKIPDWFTHQNIGSSSIDIKLDRNRRYDNWMMGFAFCMCFKARHPWSCYIHWRMKSKGNMCGYGAFELPLYGNISDDHLCLLYVPRHTFENSCVPRCKWEDSYANQIEFSFRQGHSWSVRIVYEQDVQELNSQEA